MAKLIEVEMDGVRARYRLLDEWSPKTTALFWELLPISTTMYHGRLSGDVTLFGVKDERVKELPPFELGVASIYKGFIVAAVITRLGLLDITFSYGLAEYRRATGRAYVTPLAEIEPGDAAAFLPVLGKTRKEGQRPVSVRRVG